MTFDKRAFDRAQRRKLIGQGYAKPTAVKQRSKPEPKKTAPPRRESTRSRSHRTALTSQQKRRRLDDARIEQKVAEYAEGDKMCNDVVAILQTLCEKLGR